MRRWMSAAGSASDPKSSLFEDEATAASGVDGASLQPPHPHPCTAFAASEQIIGGAPFAAVNRAATSTGAPRRRPWSNPLTVMLDPAVCAIAGTPLSEENAKVATTNPITRCMITPFIVPAFVAG